MARALVWSALLVQAALAGCTLGGPPTQEHLPSAREGAEAVAAVATGLDTVWEIAFAADGRMFVTERGGAVRVVRVDGTLDPARWAALEVEEVGEAGLMGLAFDPDFPSRPYVYLAYTHRLDGGAIANRIVRVTEHEGRGTDELVLLDGIPAGAIHDGGRLAFGPDGKLYATAGDAGDGGQAQDRRSLAGKVLRLEPDGSIPADNPMPDSYVFTLGHRNQQGLAFHPETGFLYATEHGPENHDEVNRLEAGWNYGWPERRGPDSSDPLMRASIWSSGGGGTIAPADAAFIDAPGSPLHGALVFATLKGTHLRVLELDPEDPDRVVGEHVIFDDAFGRLRALAWGEDDALYVGTSNRDGRGAPGADDDRVIRVPLSALEAAVAGT